MEWLASIKYLQLYVQENEFDNSQKMCRWFREFVFKHEKGREFQWFVKKINVVIPFSIPDVTSQRALIKWRSHAIVEKSKRIWVN